MGQGQDKVARNLVDLQPTAIVELFLLYFDTIDNETAFIAFHGGSLFANGITWQGVKYLPLPVETEGFEISANGELSRPKIKISNKDYFITDLLIKYQDLQFAKIIRKRTFVKFLDDANFDGGNPWGEADSSAEISNDTFLIGQKTAENKLFAEFELTSPLDLENFEVNNRVILARYCPWYYRGEGCNYEGPPLETEEGEKLIMNSASVLDWVNVSKNNEWKTDVNYTSGDAVFLYNQKGSIDTFSKIWYVCKEDHFSQKMLRPDLTLKYWAKDGCGKKLTNCKKRFINSEKLFINSSQGSLTNNYFNLNYLTKDNYENNIAKTATISGSSVTKQYYAENIVYNDYQDWIANEKNGTVTLTWPSGQTINQINIYDSFHKDYHIRNAVIKLYKENQTQETIIVTDIPDYKQTSLSGGVGKYIPLSPNITVTGIQISGSGSVGNLAALGCVEILKSNSIAGLSLNNDTDKIHLAPVLHISTWIQFSGGLINTKDNFNILHNVNTGCGYSGLNLFARNQDLVLQFAVAKTLRNGSTYSLQFVPQELIVPNWPFTTLVPLHIEIYKGGASGVFVNSSGVDREGYIKISSINNIAAQYTLQQERDVIDINGTVLGEKSNAPSYFKFKNPNYQGGINSNIFWGVNNIDPSNKVIMSNILLGSTAIWTGSSAISQEEKINLFNRNDDYNKLYNPSLVQKIPLKYSELNLLLKSNLYAWWDMDLLNTAPYTITSSNSPQKTLTLTGNYNSLMDYNTSISYNVESSITQTPKTFLPFGGFPATDRYGR